MFNQKGSAVVIIAIVIFLAMAASGVYFLITKKNSIVDDQPLAEINMVQSSPLSSPYPSPTISSSDTDSWNVYDSEKKDFIFEYPAAITIKPFKTEDGSVHLELREEIPLDAPGGFEQGPGYSIDFQIQEVGEKTLKEIVEDKIRRIEEYGFINQPLKQIPGGGYTFAGGAQNASTYIYLPNEATYAEIRYSLYDPNNKGYKVEVNKIIDSFEFEN